MSFDTCGIARRASLFTGSSLAAVSLVAGACALFGAPNAAFAANECGDPTTNGASADTFTCNGSPASIAYPTTSGNLTLRLQGPLTVAGGITITPTGANTVNINRLAESPAGSGDPQISNNAGAGINVERTVGGSIQFQLNDTDTGDAPLTITGTTAGIRARNAGTAITNVTFNNAVVAATAGAGIDLGTAGTGTLAVTIGATIPGAADAPIVRGTSAAISVVGGSGVTITNNASGLIDGRLSFANNGTTSITNVGVWSFSGASTLRDTAALTGSTTLTNAILGRIVTNVDAAATSIDFGVGAATFADSGTLVVGQGTEGAATLTLNGVENWNHAGRVLFGGGADFLTTDGVPNDRIVVTRTGGGNFNALSGILVMDVDFSASQADCAAAVAADCLDLRGQNLTGAGEIVVNTVGAGSASERIVLVDVAGSGTDTGAFTLSPDSPGYLGLDGGVVDGGLFLYRLSHDSGAKQYALTAAGMDREGLEFALFGRAANAAWETATGAWFDRQADLRSTLAGRDTGMSPGVWLKVAGGLVDQRGYKPIQIGADATDFNIGYDQNTLAIVGGVDLVNISGAGATWVAGVTFGSVDSEQGFKVSPTEAKYEGNSYGVYGTLMTETFFVDLIVNKTNLDTTYSWSTINVGEREGEAESLGYRLEGGYRLPVDLGAAYLEPIAAITYVDTDLSDLTIGDVNTSFDTYRRFRGALGLRLAGDLTARAVTAKFAVTGRIWEEFQNKGGARVITPSDEFDVLDDDDGGGLGDVGLAVSLFGADSHLSANLNYGVKFKEDYLANDFSIGARYQW